MVPMLIYRDAPTGDRNYRAVDPEGGRWIFSKRVKDIAPEDMVPPGG